MAGYLCLSTSSSNKICCKYLLLFTKAHRCDNAWRFSATHQQFAKSFHCIWPECWNSVKISSYHRQVFWEKLQNLVIIWPFFVGSWSKYLFTNEVPAKYKICKQDFTHSGLHILQKASSHTDAIWIYSSLQHTKYWVHGSFNETRNGQDINLTIGF